MVAQGLIYTMLNIVLANEVFNDVFNDVFKGFFYAGSRQLE